MDSFVFAKGKVFTKEKSGTHFEVKIPDINVMEDALYDMINYVCDRFGVDKTNDLTDEQYSHGCAEYMTALIKESREFRKFINAIK